MSKNGYLQASRLLLTFAFFFLSNASVLVYVLWITPEIVSFEFVLWLLVLVPCFWSMRSENLWNDFFTVLEKNWFIYPFLLFAGISVYWSVAWQVSLFRWLMLLFTIIAGGYIGLRNDLRKIVELLSVFGVYILFFSILLVIFAPKLGVMNYYIIQGAWKGIFWHKNHMGLIATFLNTLYLINVIYYWASKRKTALFWGALYLFSLVFVIQSDSVAAYMTTILLHGLVLVGMFLIKFGSYIRKSHWVMFTLVSLLGLVLVLFNLEFIFGIFGRNTSLTGRIPMWSYLFNTYFFDRPYLGYGFNAFWYIVTHRIALMYAAGYPDQIVIADNGFIDILINTGYVGFALFLLFYFGAWWSSIKTALKSVDIVGLFPLILMAYVLIANITWSLLFENEGFMMLVMISVLFSIAHKNNEANPLG